MLRELFIKNYALISRMNVKFDPHLTILSGETGAGKSIIIGALGLILGQKGKTSMIKIGKQSCTVEGRFCKKKEHPVWDLLKEKGIEVEDEDIVIRRTIMASGGSRSFINGFQVSIKDLQKITSLLIDIHGQHEHQLLLDVKTHLQLLDRYGQLEDDYKNYRESYDRYISLRKELEQLKIDEHEKQRRIDMLVFAVEEINEANLQEGEEAALEQEYKVLKNYEQIVSALSEAYRFIFAEDDSAVEKLDKALTSLNRIKDFLGDNKGWLDNLESSRILIDETAYSIRDFMESIEYEPGKIDEILYNLEKIKRLKKKYGETVEEILRYRDECEKELASLEKRDEEINKIKEEIEKEKKSMIKYAITLSARRRVAARTLEDSIQKELAFLSMDKTQFKVNFVYKESADGEVEIDGKRYKLTADGLDNVEFLIATNVGQPLMPLKNVASGGELSRIMLAIKTVLGTVDPVNTFVFDEIDVGIGGKVAWAVGNRLKDLSRFKQILCITHQAQIASRGDLNLKVEKHVVDNDTTTSVKELKGKEKVEEIARMISGETITEAALRQAEEMLKGK